MAQFIVISKSGKLFLCNCVRIAKKSLIMLEKVDGSTKVPKERCYFYDISKHKVLREAKNDIAFGNGSIIEAKRALENRLKPVTTKSTRF